MVLKEASLVMRLCLRRPPVSLAYPVQVSKVRGARGSGFPPLFSLAGGFLAIPRAGFEDVLGWADVGRVNAAQDAGTQGAPIPNSIAEEPWGETGTSWIDLNTRRADGQARGAEPAPEGEAGCRAARGKRGT